MSFYDLQTQPETNSKLIANPDLKSKLRLDFSQLGFQKAKPVNEVFVQEQKANPVPMVNKKNSTVGLQKSQPLALNLEGIKDQQGDKIIGYHEEFMSKIGEFSESWRNAANNERKIP